MGYNFDGPNKLIILTSGTTYVSVKDMYSRWKDWLVTSDNAKYLPAMSVLGGDPLPSGQMGSTFFLENGWKIRPQEANHTLSLVGNLYSRDGSDPFVNTLGVWNVRIISTVSTLVEVVTQNGIGTVQEVKDAVWGATDLGTYPVNSAGQKLEAVGASSNPWLTDLSTYTTPGTAGYIVNNVPSAHTQLFNAIDSISGGVGINAGATSFTLTQGTVVSGTFEDTHTFNDAEHYIRDNAGQFDIQYLFDIETDSAPTSFTFIGYVADKHEVLTISAWNYRTSQWEQITAVSGTNTNKSFTGTLYRDHVGYVAGQIGDVKIRMHSNVISDLFVHIDQMYVSYVKTEKQYGYSGHVVTATANTITLGVDASSIDGYYVPSILSVDHGTGLFQYAKVIGYTGSTRTLQLELPMATTLDSTSHITLSPWASAKIETSQYTNIDNKLTTVTNATDTLEASATQIAGYVDTLETSVGAIKAVTDTMPTAANIAEAVRTELTPELTHITTLQNGQGLDSNQAIMLLELFKLSGLDPTKPLIVTKTTRVAGDIHQSITGDANSTTVTRV